MKEFRTELIPKKSSSLIRLSDKIFTIGSCFSDEIGQLLIENKFTVSKNPLGTVYNPVSIHQLLLLGLNKTFPPRESYSQNDDIHFNYHFHSSFSSLSREEIESKIERAIAAENSFLRNANWIIITYGTAFVYRLKDSSGIVANCHKMPVSNFDKTLLTSAEIEKSFEEFYSCLRSVNSTAKIILTVSPVRHLKDSPELNAVSKSILRIVCHTISSQFSDVEYFPAYEILIDDLRDYRFYKADRIHPTEEAIDYIWEKLVDSYFDERTRKFLSEWRRIKADLAHRPFNARSERHQRFLRALLSDLSKLSSEVDVSDETRSLKKFLTDHGFKG